MADAYAEGLEAVAVGDASRLGALLTAQPGLATAAADSPDWPASTLLEHAVWWHRREMVDALVAAGAPVDRPGGSPPMSPLQRALEMGADDLAGRLAQAGTDLETAAGLGDMAGVRAGLAIADAAARRRAFRLACLNGRRETALALCPTGWFDDEALVDTLLRGRHLLTWDQGETAWDWAAEQLELADPLNVFSFEKADDAGRTLLDAARAGGDAATVALVERRTPREVRRLPPERAWRPMNSPLAERFLFACQWGQTARVREFLAADPDLVRSRTFWNAGALYLPGAYGSTGSVATGLLLLEAGAPAFDGIDGPSWWGAVDLVKALLDHGAPPERPERRQSGLLSACAATRYNDEQSADHWLPIIDALLDAGADPNLADRFGVTPWGFAHDTVRPHLERRGARPEARPPGLPELREKLAADSEETVAIAAANPELLDFCDEATGCTPVLAALLDGGNALAERLLAIKGDPDLNEAAALGDAARVATLLDELGVRGPRAGIDPPDVPLHFAVWRADRRIVELLLERGYSAAAMNRADEAGKHQGIAPLRDTTPIHAAAQAGHADILAILLDRWDAHWSGT